MRQKQTGQDELSVTSEAALGGETVLRLADRPVQLCQVTATGPAHDTTVICC